MSDHCIGEPSITPWRQSAHGTVYAVKVCACGEQAEYVEIEADDPAIMSNQEGPR